MTPALRFAALLALALAPMVAGCATGDDGLMPRNPDGAVRTDGGGPRLDAGGSDICTPTCPVGQTCREGLCVSATIDLDGDGVPSASDCDDRDATVSATAERACTSRCGAGVELCSSAVWGPCSAPEDCDCGPGTSPRELDCAMCGTQRQVCLSGSWVDDGGCMGQGACLPGATEMGAGCACGGTQRRTCTTSCAWGAYECVGGATECAAGAVDTETRACPGGCGMSEMRSRTCAASCTWGAFGAWSGCSSCGPVCGNGTCESGETCSACADCRYGHMGTGSGGSSCAGVPAEHWRCVTQSGLGLVSQVCRSGSWVNFNLSPMNCNACVCTFSQSCCQPGSPSGGC